MDQKLKNYYLDNLGIQRWLLRDNCIKHSLMTNIVKMSQPTQTSPNDTDERWRTLQQQVTKCTACALCKSRTQTVFGIGNKLANLMIIGEAPGYYEDQQGEPFVGRAGKLLDSMLKAIDLNREKVYIANILKCRPPNNRDPLAEEVESCTPFLQQQIALVKPKVLLAVGRISAHFLLNTKTPIGRLRGRIYHYSKKNIPLLVSYHPAYLLRSPLQKQKAYVDLCKVKQLLLED